MTGCGEKVKGSPVSTLMITSNALLGALRPGKEKALYQVSKRPSVYRQERVMAETMERLTAASLQVISKIPGFLSTLGRWLKNSAGYVHEEDESPLHIIAIKLAFRPDLSQFEKVPAALRTS